MSKGLEYCNCCKNKDVQDGALCKQCLQDDGKWTRRVNFEPLREVREFFHYGWCNMNDHDYYWNSTHENLVPTKAVQIGNNHYCPYCACTMFPIQNKNFDVTGYRCFCDGANAELEWKAEDKALREKHEQELIQIRQKYIGRVKSNLPALFEIKQRKEKESFDFHHWDRTLFQMGSQNIIDVEDLI